MSVLRSVFSSRAVSVQSVGRLAFTPAVHLQASSFASSSRVGLDFTRPRRDEPAAPPSSSSSPLPTSPSAQATETPSAASQDATPSTSAAAATSARTTMPMTRPRPSSGVAPRSSRPEAAVEANPLDRAKADIDGITHTLTVASTRNNVFLTFADHVGPVFPTITAGSGQQFKNSQRASHEAAHQATLKVIDKVLGMYRTSGRRDLRIRVAFKGVFGLGREAVAGCLGGNDGIEVRRLIARVEDRTPFKIGGTRAPKVRRL